MFKKALPKPTDVSCLGRAKICLHVYHHLRHSCCAELFHTSHECNISSSSSSSSVHPNQQQPVQNDNPANNKLTREEEETTCLVCQSLVSRNNERMARCGTAGASFRLSSTKNIGSQCVHYLGQLLQLRRWKSAHSVAPALGHVYPGNGVGNRDLKRFLEEVGTNPKEARYWLKQFQLVGGSTPSRPFAVVQVDQEIFHDSKQLKALSSNLAFLHRNDMKLLVVHGANLPEDEYLSDQELQNSRHQVTTETMVMVNFLEASGAPAHPIFSGSNVLSAESVGRGTKGKVINVNKEALEWCISSGHIPVLSSIGETSSSQLVSIDAAHATAEVAKAVQAMKVLFLNTTGGLRDRSGKIIEEVNIPADLDALMKQSCSGQDHRTKELVSGLVAGLPPLSSVVITSARTILTELFTHHGAGTMFKKTERILKYSSLKDVDIDRLKKLLTRSFGRVLRDNYFQELDGRLHTVYLSEGYSAVAIITKEAGVTVPYLDKFSISLQRQGEGTSDMLWNCVRRDFPSLFWRSRMSNKVNAWYFKRSEGSWSNSKWTVFWYGISNQQLSYTLVEWAVKKPKSFHETEEDDEWTAITESL